MELHLLDKEDVLTPKNRKKDKEYIEKVVIKKKPEKPEKPIRIIRIKYYQKISLPFMENGKLDHKDIFAVDRGLDDLLKALYYNTNIQGTISPPGCIFVEKDNRMGSNNKFIFIDINRDEFFILKRQMENHTTIQEYNKGEFSILEGKRSSLSETFNIPRIRKEIYEDKEHRISDTNIIIMREKLREELKDKFRPYHSYEDERIDNMKENELIALKKLSKRKMEIEYEKIKSVKKLLWKIIMKNYYIKNYYN